MRLLLLVLLLVSPVWSAPREWEIKAGHRKALLGLGLPLYWLPEASGVTYRKATIEFTPDSRSYQIQYSGAEGLGTGDPLVYCSSQRYTLSNVGKPLETQRILAGQFGSLNVTRFKRVCRTGWLRRGGGWVQVESECANLARFGQLLEQFRVTPGSARRPARIEAIRAADLDAYEIPGLPIKSTTVVFDPFNWNSYDLVYSTPGKELEQGVSGDGIRDFGLGFDHPTRREVRAGTLNFSAYVGVANFMKGKPWVCYTGWCKVTKGFILLKRQGKDFDRFCHWVSQLRRVP